MVDAQSDLAVLAQQQCQENYASRAVASGSVLRTFRCGFSEFRDTLAKTPSRRFSQRDNQLHDRPGSLCICTLSGKFASYPLFLSCRNPRSRYRGEGTFSQWVQSIGSTPVERWRKILRRAQEEGALCRRRRAITVFVRHHFDLKRKIHSRYPMPAWLTMAQLNH